MATNQSQPQRVERPPTQPAQPPAVDLEALVEKLWALLKDELRVERERRGH